MTRHRYRIGTSHFRKHWTRRKKTYCTCWAKKGVHLEDPLGQDLFVTHFDTLLAKIYDTSEEVVGVVVVTCAGTVDVALLRLTAECAGVIFSLI